MKTILIRMIYSIILSTLFVCHSWSQLSYKHELTGIPSTVSSTETPQLKSASMVNTDLYTLETDSLALVDLYNSTGGPNWTYNTNWLTGPMHTWHGVEVTNERVIYLILNNNNLAGTLPPSIGQMTKLEILGLSYNMLSGTIPAEIGNLVNLRTLDLDNNMLTGNLPSEIGNMTNLEDLGISHNQLQGQIPVQIGNLGKLNSIRLRHNNFSGSIPPEIGNMTSLNVIVLDNNSLEGSIPSEIGSLINLTFLDLNSNQLTGEIPMELGNLVNLNGLFLFSNQLTGSIPATLGNISSLEDLNLSDNQLSGVIPPEIGNLSLLTSLQLYKNSLSGQLPPAIGNLSKLNWLYISGNKLEGDLPPEISNLTNLWGLFIDQNLITSLPDMSILPNLLYLECSNNKLDFSDLEPNIHLSGFWYSPQDSTGRQVDTLLYAGSGLSYELQTGGLHNRYQWFKDGLPLPEQTTSFLNIPVVQPTDAGNYYCQVYNTVVTGLMLTSRMIHLDVEAPPIDGCLYITTIEDWKSYDFSTSTQGISVTGGDFYFLNDGSLKFWANNTGQRGLIDLGDLGDIPLYEVQIPESGYNQFGVDAIAGHTYVSQAAEGEDNNFIVFRVLELDSSRALVAYSYQHISRATLSNGNCYDFSEHAISGYLFGGDLYYTSQLMAFYANMQGQNGLVSLGNMGNIPLNQVPIPDDGYNQHGVLAVECHTYVSLASDDEEGSYIVFRILNISETDITIDYFYRNKYDYIYADAGPDQTVPEGALVTLNGTASVDPAGLPLTYHWIVPEGITLSSVTNPSPSFTAPAVTGTENPQYTIYLMVGNGTDTSLKDKVIIRVEKAVEFEGGSGTPEDPWLIATAQQLNDMRYRLNGYYRQVADIDLGLAPWNEGEGWMPIGVYGIFETGEGFFTGSYDGNGYKIMNLTINRPEMTRVGLFGATGKFGGQSLFQNITMTGVDITGYYWAGSIAGVFELGSSMVNCSVYGRVSGLSYIGGLSGICFNNSKIERSFFHGEVTGDQFAGGLTGQLVGRIIDSYSSGAVNGSELTGGLVGQHWSGPIENSYSISLVTGVTNAGGLTGDANYGSVTNCFWDTETSNQHTSPTGAGKTSIEMIRQATFTGWDFDQVWKIEENRSYPFLAWQLYPAPHNMHPNHPPVAHAGSAQTVNKWSLVSLDATASTDDDGDALTYHWTAPDGIILNADSTAFPTFTAPSVETDQTFTFWLVINDGIIDSEPASVSITVKNISSPVITYPSEPGITWKPDTIYNITWHDFTDPYVKLELLKGHMVVRTITSGTTNDGTMLWKAPALQPGSDYRIRITSTINPEISDLSNYHFTLAPATIPKINYPSDPGIVWNPGTIYEILWQDSNDPYVKLELLKGETLVRTITTATANDGAMLWKAPAIAPGTDYRIRITSTATPSMTDISDNFFAIYPAAMPNVIYPSEHGLVWNPGTINEILWQDFTDPYVKLELLKGETVVRTITTGTANDGAMLWKAPALESGTDYRIRITSTSNPAMSDISDEYFALQLAASPRIAYPSEPGIVWNPGTIYEITWQDFTDPYMKLELLKGETVVRTITKGTANDGTMLWRAPALESGVDYRIRITSTTTPAMTDISDNPFRISGPPLVTYPSASGIVWNTGTIYEITWQDFTDPYVKVELLKGETVVRTITTATANDGAMLWRIATTLEPGTDYRIRITSTATPTMTDVSDNPVTIVVPKSALAFGDDPDSNSLSVYPNPFSNRVTITYTLAEPGRTLLEIYDLTGRRVTILEDSTREAGTYVMEWNAVDANGQRVTPGIYLCRIQSGGFVETVKLVFNK